MQLSQTARLERHHRRCQCGGDGEVARVDNGNGPASAGRLGHVDLRQFVHVRRVALEVALRRVNLRRGDGLVGWHDVGVRRRKRVEEGGVDAKVLGQDVLWRVC